LHDEVIVEAREDIAEDMAQIVKTSRGNAFEKLMPDKRFKVETEIRDS
jgi:DNA polymerase I-like protein with 3'-5' exonuclease and polymerase domains